MTSRSARALKLGVTGVQTKHMPLPADAPGAFQLVDAADGGRRRRWRSVLRVYQVVSGRRLFVRHAFVHGDVHRRADDGVTGDLLEEALAFQR
jgi:hypothetical protein